MKHAAGLRLGSYHLLLFLAMGIVAIHACSVLAAGDKNSALPVITSGSEIDYPPFCVVGKHGEAAGFSVELIQAAAAAMECRVAFRVGPWADVRTWLEKGVVQALPLVDRTPEREAIFDFTFPYMSLHGAIVVRTGTKGIAGMEDLKGRKVAVMRGDSAEEFLRREDRGIHIQLTPTFEEALRHLSAGRYDAVVIQRIVGLRLIRETRLNNLQVLNRPVKEFRQDFCFAVREGDRDTLALLNEGLALVIADGTYSHLHAKWFAALELPTDRPIVIGGGFDYPPYEYLDEEGRPAGYNVDLTRAIAHEVGLDVEIRLGLWSDIKAEFDRGKIDAIQGMFYSPQRDLSYDFTAPHIVNHYISVMRRQAGDPPGTPAELTGKHIVVQRDDIMHDYALNNGLGAHLAVVDTQEAALRELARGKHDCALVSRLTARYWIERHGWHDLILGHRPLLSPGSCYAVHHGNKALLAQLSEGLNLLESTGEYRRIYKKWMGVYEDSSPRVLTLFKYAAMAAAPLFLLLTGSMLWSWTLRRKVDQKTRELEESMARFRHLFEAANVGKSMTRPSGEVDANKAFADFLGYTQQEMKAKRWQDLTPAEDIEAIESILAPIVAGRSDSVRFEKRYLHKDGSVVWGDVSTVMRRDAAGNPLHFLTTIVDITKRKRSEEEREKLQTQLLQARKMESVGRLAGGVAHDYNNMLGVILGYTELAMDSVFQDDPLCEYLEEILGAAKRSADITRQLLAFARQQTIQPRVIDLNASVESLVKMLGRLIGEDIEIVWKPQAGLWPVKMDPSQIDQILVNLCLNARDAINAAGNITIETDTVHFDETYCADHAGFVTGDFILLAISDDGCGMDAHTIENIFEPFFTTKSRGRGTGLGLATVYGIVKQNNGFINVYSEKETGTTFKVYLPRHVGDVDQVHAGRQLEHSPGGSETVLVVEDDTAILKLTRKMLKELGYVVLDASGPRQAIELAQKPVEKIDLLITDVVMPEMDGKRLSHRIQGYHPDLKVLFMSGYTTNVIAHRGVLERGVHFIQKPFSKKDLALSIRRALEKQDAIPEDPVKESG